jgi:hypothetical protein
MNLLSDSVRSFFSILTIVAVALLLVDLATHAAGITRILDSIFGEVNAGFGSEAQAAGYTYQTRKGQRG